MQENADSTTSYTIRPIVQTGSDSFYQVHLGVPDTKPLVKRKAFSLLFIPVVFNQQITTHHPLSWNDGSMVPAKGYQAQFSAGAFIKLGFLSLQLRPELVFAQNSAFASIASGWSDTIWKSYYTTVINKIDQPDRFGNKAFARFFPGQSSLRVNFKKLSLGVSTENLWWGPGVRNSLIMTNNAPGFLHLTFNTTAPVITSIGSIEWQFIGGRLKASGILPDTTKTFNGIPLYDPKPQDDRYVNGAVVCWQPKWTKGFYIGFSRLFYLYETDVKPSLNGYFPIAASFFKSEHSNEDQLKRDQIASLFFRLVLPGAKAELYGEYGRNDHSSNVWDFLMEPEHSRAFILGFQKIFPLEKNRAFEVMTEFANLGMSKTTLVREQESWYAHYQVRDGFTNKGQVVGAAIGPGSNSQTLGGNWLSNKKQIGFRFERVTHNNDFYYDAFAPLKEFMEHWVDLSLGFNSGWTHKRFFYRANLSVIRSLNYYWQKNVDVNNVSLNFSTGYIF